MAPAWKSIQLSAVMLWTASTQSEDLEQYIVEQNIFECLVDIVNDGQ